MWPFNKKQKESLDLPPFPVPKPSSYDLGEEILIDNAPDELPPLQEKQPINVPEKEIPMDEEFSQENPVQERSVVISKPIKMTSNDVFISTESQNKIIAAISDVEYDFDVMENEAENAESVRVSKELKMDSMQKCLEDISKKLMEIDNSLFGG